MWLKNAVNRNLLLCSLPSFVFITILITQSSRYWPRGEQAAMAALLLFVPFEFIAPICVIVGWVLFREDKRRPIPVGTPFARNVLIVATLMATPLPLYVVSSLLYGLFRFLHLAR
jgi:hypothetical protein